MVAAEAVGAGVPTLVTDYPLGRLLASKGAAVMCERSPQAIAIGIERLLSEEGARIGRTGRAFAAEPFLGQSRPVLARTGRRIDAGGNVKALTLTVAIRSLPLPGPREAIAWQRSHGGRPACVHPARQRSLGGTGGTIQQP